MHFHPNWSTFEKKTRCFYYSCHHPQSLWIYHCSSNHSNRYHVKAIHALLKNGNLSQMLFWAVKTKRYSSIGIIFIFILFYLGVFRARNTSSSTTPAYLTTKSEYRIHFSLPNVSYSRKKTKALVNS